MRSYPHFFFFLQEDVKGGRSTEGIGEEFSVRYLLEVSLFGLKRSLGAWG